MRSIVLVCVAACTARAHPQTPPGDAATTVIELFRRYDVVGLPELHGHGEVHELLRALIADPRLVDAGVTNIAVEFGNARLQAVADRFVRGEDVPDAELRAIWRETGQLLVWDSPLYEQFFRRVREVNAQRPPARRLRVLLGDPPLDWQQVHSKDDDLRRRNSRPRSAMRSCSATSSTSPSASARPSPDACAARCSRATISAAPCRAVARGEISTSTTCSSGPTGSAVLTTGFCTRARFASPARRPI